MASPRLGRILLCLNAPNPKDSCGSPGKCQVGKLAAPGVAGALPDASPHYNEQRGEFPALAGAEPVTFSSSIFLSGRADGSVAS